MSSKCFANGSEQLMWFLLNSNCLKYQFPRISRNILTSSVILMMILSVKFKLSYLAQGMEDQIVEDIAKYKLLRTTFFGIFFNGPEEFETSAMKTIKITGSRSIPKSFKI